jgi:hypothetical protein
MEELKPVKNNQRNLEERTKLSLHLTGRPNATEEEMLAAIDMWDKQKRDSVYTPIGKGMESKNTFLSELEKITYNIIGIVKELENQPHSTAKYEAQSILKIVLNLGPKYSNIWDSKFESQSTQKEKQIYDALCRHLGLIKTRLIGIISEKV